jgi:hypothetical protein
VKLPQLNSAIRDADAVRIGFNLVGRHPIVVVVQKTSMLEALKGAFPDRGETGMYLRDDGFLMLEGADAQGSLL